MDDRKFIQMNNVKTRNDFVRAYLSYDKFLKSGNKQGRKNELFVIFEDDNGNDVCKFSVYETARQYFITKVETYIEECY